MIPRPPRRQSRHVMPEAARDPVCTRSAPWPDKVRFVKYFGIHGARSIPSGAQS